MKGKWEKFKHRTLTKVFLGYAVVAWVLIQVIEAVLPTFETPLWVAQTITFLLILGFPIAILVGWASEKLPAASGVSGNPSEVPQLAHATPRRTLVWVGTGSCLVVGLFGFYMMPFIFNESAFEQTRNRSGFGRELALISNSLKYKLMLENKGTRGNGTQSEISVSPNGRYIVYTEFASPALNIYLHDFTSFDEASLLITITQNIDSGYPQFSSDGQWIYYFDSSQIFRIRREGGTPQLVIDEGVSIAGLTTIGSDVIYRNVNGSLESYNLGSEIISPLMNASGEPLALDYSWPQFIAGTSKMLATRGGRGAYTDLSVDLIDLESGEIKVIAPNGLFGRFVSSGHVIFGRDEALWAQPVDPDTFELSGDAVPVIFDVEAVPAFGRANYDISNDGRLVYTSKSDFGPNFALNQIALVNRLGDEQILEVTSGRHFWPRINPNNTLLSLTTFTEDGNPDIWVYDLVNGTLGRRSFTGNSGRAIWSLDGFELIYQCNDMDICITAADGTSSAQNILAGFQAPVPTYLSRDGTLILEHGNPSEIFITNLNESSETSLTNLNLSPSGTESSDGVLSPDESWIAYSSDETGREEIYVRPYPEVTSGKWQVSRNGGRYPRWNQDTSEIFWWDRVNLTLLNSQYEVSQGNSDRNSISFSNPETLYETPYRFSGSTSNWDYSPKDDNAVFIKRTNSAANPIQSQIEIHIVDDFFGELQGLAPSNFE